MERKDLTPTIEVLFNLYNNTHEHKIKLEHVEEMYISDNKLTIIWEDYDENGASLGYLGYDMDIPDAE